MVKAMEYAFGIQIDRYALAHFTASPPDRFHRWDRRHAGEEVRGYQQANLALVPGGLRLKAGVNHLDGIHTLAFCAPGDDVRL